MRNQTAFVNNLAVPEVAELMPESQEASPPSWRAAQS